MKKNLLLIILTAAVLLTGCKSLFTREGNLLSDAKQQEKMENYHAAVINVVESIKIDNEYDDAIEFLIDIYPRSINFYTIKIDQARSGSESYDQIVVYYENLKSINDSVRSLPQLINPKTKMGISFTYTDYSAELAAAREIAAEDHYIEGLRLFKMKGRENAKAAAIEFETALSYVPNYKDASVKATQALEAGTQVLAFFPFVNNAWNIPTAQFSDIMQNRIISNLMNDSDVMKFTKIIDRSMQDKIIEEQVGSLSAMMDDKSRVEIGKLLSANIFITGTIDSAKLEGPSTSMNQYLRTAEIEVEQAVESESSGFYKTDSTDTLDSSEDDSSTPFYKTDGSAGEPVYTTKEVSAHVFVYRKTIGFDVVISYKAIDVETGMILKTDTVSIFSEDSSEWAEWSGNEEALTSEDKILIDTYEESVMSARQIATQAAEDAGTEIALGLSAYLK